jgi:hypothetical protein
MAGIETPTCFGTVATSLVAFFVATANGSLLLKKSCYPDAVSWLAEKLSSLRNHVQLVRIMIIPSSSGYLSLHSIPELWS